MSFKLKFQYQHSLWIGRELLCYLKPRNKLQDEFNPIQHATICLHPCAETYDINPWWWTFWEDFSKKNCQEFGRTPDYFVYSGFRLTGNCQYLLMASINSIRAEFLGPKMKRGLGSIIMKELRFDENIQDATNPIGLNIVVRNVWKVFLFKDLLSQIYSNLSLTHLYIWITFLYFQ